MRPSGRGGTTRAALRTNARTAQAMTARQMRLPLKTPSSSTRRTPLPTPSSRHPIFHLIFYPACTMGRLLLLPGAVTVACVQCYEYAHVPCICRTSSPSE